MSEDSANAVKWSDVCAAFEKVLELNATKLKGKGQRRLELLLPPVILSWARRGHQSIFPYARLLMPDKDDARRGKYHLAEKTLAQLFIAVWSIMPESEEAKTLLNYRAGGSYHGRAIATPVAGDFASTLYEVVVAQKRTGKGVWTVRDVNVWLDELIALQSLKETEGRAERQKVVFRRICELDALQQKWLVREILHDLKLGVHHEALLAYYHPDALETFNTHTSLRNVFEMEELRNPSVRSRSEISLGVACQPCLATKISIEHGASFLKDMKHFYIEQKLDGDRMLAHVSPDSVRLFSRKSNEFPDYANILAPYLRRALGGPDGAREAILDGELMTWDPEFKRYSAFGNNRTTAVDLLRDSSSHRHLCYLVFDVLWVKGWTPPRRLIELDLVPNGNITSWKLENRKRVLHALVHKVDHFVETIEPEESDNESAEAKKKRVFAAFEKCIDKGFEGLVLKSAEEPYVCGERMKGWLKMKPEYAEGAFETLDCVIVGGTYADSGGAAKRGKITRFLLAVADDTSRRPPEEGKGGLGLPKRWIPLTGVGSGFTLDELSDLTDKLASKWVDYVPGTPAPDYLGGWVPSAKTRPDKFIRTIDSDVASVVLEIKGSEIFDTPDFPLGYTVRFARVVRIRFDKPLSEAATSDDILRMKERGMARKKHDGEYSFGARSSSSLARAQANGGSLKRPRAAAGTSVAAAFLPGNTLGVKTERDLLRGAEVFVLPQNWKDAKNTTLVPPDLRSRGAVEALVKRCGGRTTNMGSEHTEYWIGYKLDTQAAQHARTHSIMTPAWLQSCFDADALIEPLAVHFVSANAVDTATLRLFEDPFGDRHAEALRSIDELRALLKRVPQPSASSSVVARAAPAAAAPAAAGLVSTLFSFPPQQQQQQQLLDPAVQIAAAFDDAALGFDLLVHPLSLFRDRTPALLQYPPPTATEGANFNFSSGEASSGEGGTAVLDSCAAPTSTSDSCRTRVRGTVAYFDVGSNFSVDEVGGVSSAPSSGATPTIESISSATPASLSSTSTLVAASRASCSTSISSAPPSSHSSASAAVSPTSTWPLLMRADQLRLYSGTVSPSITSDVNVIIVEDGVSQARLRELCAAAKHALSASAILTSVSGASTSRPVTGSGATRASAATTNGSISSSDGDDNSPSIPIVSQRWVARSIAAGTMLPLREFIVQIV